MTVSKTIVTQYLLVFAMTILKANILLACNKLEYVNNNDHIALSQKLIKTMFI